MEISQPPKLFDLVRHEKIILPLKFPTLELYFFFSMKKKTFLYPSSCAYISVMKTSVCVQRKAKMIYDGSFIIGTFFFEIAQSRLFPFFLFSLNFSLSRSHLLTQLNSICRQVL